MSDQIISVQNGKEVILSGDELKAFEADVKMFNDMIENQKSEAEAKAQAREAALAKLAALGLTQEEIGAL